MATQVQDTLTRPMAQPGAGGDMRHLLVASIIASKTNPRTHFPDASMASLRENIRAIGVRQPVLVRPLPASRVEETTRGARVGRVPTWPLALSSTVDVAIEYELVAGERRWRCSDLEGLEYIPALICHMTDEEVVAFQLVENLQREDLTPLEEATGYRRLMDEFGLSLAQIAERTGNSKSQIHSMVKLLSAIPAVQQALEESKLPSTRHALLIARLPNEGLQKKALEKALHKDYEQQQISVRSFESWLQREVLLKLNDARFAIKDATLVPEAGACKACPKRTGADAEAFAFASTDLCLDPGCYRAKEDAHTAQVVAEAQAKGQTVIAGEEAAELVYDAYNGKLKGYRRLDNAEDSPTDKPLRSIIGKQMEAEGINPTMIENPRKRSDLLACLPNDVAGRLLKAVEGQAKATNEVASEVKELVKTKEAKALEKAKAKYEQAWRDGLIDRAWATMNKETIVPLFSLEVHRYVVMRDVHSLSSEDAAAVADVLGLGKVGAHSALIDYAKTTPSPDFLQLLVIMQRDSSPSHYAHNRPKNEGLMLVAGNVFKDRLEEVIGELKAQAEAEHLPKAAAEAAKAAKQAEEPGAQPADEKAPGAKKPAALARSNARAKKSGGAAEAPKDSPQHAAAQIAAALAELEEGQDVAPTAQGDEAHPAPAGGDAPQPSQPAGAVQLDAQVRIKPNATGKKQAPHIGKKGTVLRQIGPDAWDVSIPREKRGVPLFVCFHTTELEVL